MNDVIVYTTDPCSFCSRAKALLNRPRIEYDEINLAKDPAGRAELLQRTGMMSFPQILIDDELVGGFQELLQADRTASSASCSTRRGGRLARRARGGPACGPRALRPARPRRRGRGWQVSHT